MSGDIRSASVERLVDLLGDVDPDLRLQSALKLGEGRHGLAAGALVERFGSERDFQVREVLTWAVLRMPDVSLPLVRDALGSLRWLARLQATHTISKVGAREDGARLVPLVSDPIDAVASRAYWAAAQCGDPVVIPALTGQLSRGSSEHRNSLLVAFSSFRAAAVPALVGAVRYGASPAIRAHAADILAYLGSPEADPAVGVLVQAVEDPDEQTHLAALNALGQLELPEAWSMIDETASCEQPRLRALATRLTKRRPSSHALSAGRARARHDAIGPDDDLPEVPLPKMDGPWPTPDLDLVTCEGGPLAAKLAPLLALQVEVCRPQYLTRHDVPPGLLDEVGAAAREAALARGKSDKMADRIAAGAVEHYVHEHAFLEQVSVYDPGKIIKDLLFGTDVKITDFARLEPPQPHPPRTATRP